MQSLKGLLNNLRNTHQICNYSMNIENVTLGYNITGIISQSWVKGQVLEEGIEVGKNQYSNEIFISIFYNFDKVFKS